MLGGAARGIVCPVSRGVLNQHRTHFPQPLEPPVYLCHLLLSVPETNQLLKYRVTKTALDLKSREYSNTM